MSKQAKKRANHRPLIAVLLLIAAIAMSFMAWQSMSTEQYKLYSRNYDYYKLQASECRDKAEANVGYAILADEWEDSAKMANAYLLQHRAGAVSLGVVALVCVALCARLLVVRPKQDEAEEQKPKKG